MIQGRTTRTPSYNRPTQKRSRRPQRVLRASLRFRTDHVHGTRKELRAARHRAKWYPLWESRGYFKPARTPRAPPYCIQLPPPNVTGTLHMGHAFQQTLMDVLIRYHRMRGDNTLGRSAPTTPASRRRSSSSSSSKPKARRATTSAATSSSSASGRGRRNPASTITRQMRRLGASADWSPGERSSRWTRHVARRRRDVRAAVRATASSIAASASSTGTRSSAPRCPTSRSTARRRRARSGRSAIPLADGTGALVVATTRPETMLGDVAVAVNPEDERYAPLVGKRRAAAADRPHDPGHRRRLRRPRIRHRLRQDHAGARFQRLAGRPAPQAAADRDPSRSTRRSTTTRRQSIAASTATPRASACSPTSRPQGLLVSRESRTRWSCRAAGAPARSSSRC